MNRLVGCVGRHWHRACVVLLLVWAVGSLASGLYIHAKAGLAQYLLDIAWEQTLAEGRIHKPWEWADTWPVGRLRLANEQESQVVLAGASGRTLAFGPGLLWPSTWPTQNEPSLIAIAGHRDTHFAGLKHLQAGSTITLQGMDGRWQTYEVTSTEVVDSRKTMLDFSSPGQVSELVLITCYPFEQIQAGGPLRYVVYARRAEAPAVQTS